MAAKRTKAPEPKPDEQAEADVPETPDDHTGWAHSWRNDDAKFADDDQCIDARLARLRR